MTCAYPGCNKKETKKFWLKVNWYYLGYCGNHFKGAREFIGHMEDK